MTAQTTEDAAYEQKCKDYIHKEGIKAEQQRFSESVHTAADAIRLVGAKAAARAGTKGDKGGKGDGAASGVPVVVKTVVLAAGFAVGAQGVDKPLFVACILRGDKRVDMGAMREVLGTGRVRTATAEEVLVQTGYPAGGVPPFGHDLATYIDDEAMELTDVIAGGGSDRTLLKTTIQEIARVTKAHVARIAQRGTVAHAPTHKNGPP